MILSARDLLVYSGIEHELWRRREKLMLGKLIETVVSTVFEAFFGDWLAERRAYRRTFIRYGMRLVIRACDGNYIEIDGAYCKGFRRSLDANQYFILCDPDQPFSDSPQSLGRKIQFGDKIALRHEATKNHVGVNLEDECRLACTVPWIQLWETFEIHQITADTSNSLRYGTPFALKACNNDYFVMYNNDQDKLLYAKVTWIQLWETFAFLDPDDPVA